MNKFVKTSDSAVVDELRKAGFTELPKEGNMFVFLNDGHANFSDDDKKKVVYTNKMNI